MPPTPMTATVSPGRTLARLSTAPVPVTTAQPMRQAASNGTARVDHDRLGVAHDGALGEHAGVGELERLLAADGERPGQAAEGVAAVGRLAAVAGVALAAVAEGREHDVVADGDLAHADADGLDDAGALVAEHDRRRERDRAVEHRDVGVAEPGALDADDDLAGPGLGVAQLDVVADLQLAGPDEAPHRASNRRVGWAARGRGGRRRAGARRRARSARRSRSSRARPRAATSSGRRRWGSRGRTPCGRGRSCRGRR